MRMHACPQICSWSTYNTQKFYPIDKYKYYQISSGARASLGEAFSPCGGPFCSHQFNGRHIGLATPPPPLQIFLRASTILHYYITYTLYMSLCIFKNNCQCSLQPLSLNFPPIMGPIWVLELFSLTLDFQYNMQYSCLLTHLRQTSDPYCRDTLPSLSKTKVIMCKKLNIDQFHVLRYYIP